MQRERRAGATRFKVNLMVQGRVPVTPAEAVLSDISATGCMIEASQSANAALGATILLAITSSVTVSGTLFGGMARG